MPLLFVLGCALTAAPLVDEAALGRTLELLQRHAAAPLPELAPAQRAQLARGEVVALYRAPAPPVPCGASGLVVLPLPRDRLWRIVRGDQAGADSDLTTHRLAVEGGDEISYGHLRLPWPFAARRWQVRSRDNLALAAATQGRARERSWSLEPDDTLARRAAAQGAIRGVSAADFEAAVATPYNRGAWIAVELDGQHTLLGFSVITQVGGVIPDELVARYSVLRVAEELRAVERQGLQAPPDAGALDVARR